MTPFPYPDRNGSSHLFHSLESLGLDFRVKIFLIDRFDGRFLLDGVLALLLVTLETFDKLDGGTDAAALPAALASVKGWVSAKLQ